MSSSASSRKPRPRRTRQPVKPGLKGFVEARKQPNDLLREIQTHVVAQGIKNSGVGRESHKIHVSELTKDPCSRQLFYKVSKTEPSDAPKGAFHRLEMIWAAGNHEHEKWQQWLWEMGDLWGSWRCQMCQHEWEALAPLVCPECRSDLVEYIEVQLEDTDYPLVGHADGAVPRLNVLVEVKTFSVGTMRYEDSKRVSEHTHKIEGKTVIDHEGLWASINRPLKSHLVQGLMYLWMCKRQGLPYEKITFIYENKGTQATKTFTVGLSERYIKEYLEILSEVEAAVYTGITPERPPLFDKEGRPCKDCVFRSLCWENSDNAEETSEVPTRRRRRRSEEASGEAAVPPARETGDSDSGRARRPNRVGRPRPDHDDDPADSVGRAPRRATGDGRGGRATRGVSDGEAQGPRIARRHRQGRHQNEG